MGNVHNVCCGGAGVIEEEAGPLDGLVKSKPGGGGGNLLDTYKLGEVLGQGAFGVVYECRMIAGSGNFDYAVKMVDKVETPVAEIRKEAELLRDLSHPNVVRFHEVYYEKIFVCIVMDRHRGGDMIEGMQEHWKKVGKIPSSKIAHVCRQMVAAIAHLHSRNVCHRDVKGDNFLQDRPNLVDPQCQIIITDFGTAVKVNPGERMAGNVGTRVYWSPEFYSKDYSFKVDVFAIGVITYGLLDGRFPFKNEKDARSKQVKPSSSCSKQAKDFILKLLEKKESDRPDANQALRHPLIADAKNPASEAEDAAEANWKPEGVKEQVGAGLDQRRKELVQRLEEVQKSKDLVATDPAQRLKGMYGGNFQCADYQRRGSGVERLLVYDWSTPEQAEEKKLLPQASEYMEGVGQSSIGDRATVERQLKDHNIATDVWGTGEMKTLQEFADEVDSGTASLLLDASEHKKLVRVVDVLLLRLSYVDPDGKTYFLVESSETFPDGRSRQELNRMPGAKKAPYENRKRVAKRIITDQLGLDTSQVSWNKRYETFEEQEDARSYPGVMTLYRKDIMEGFVSGAASWKAGELARLGLCGTEAKSFTHQDKRNHNKTFLWLTEADCEKKKVKLRAPEAGSEVSSLVQAPVGYREEDLTKYLQDNSVDVSKFAESGAASLQAFSDELMTGESTLLLKESKVWRVVDVVLLKLTKETGEILTETSESKDGGLNFVSLNRLPGAKHRVDENQFQTAKRIIKQQLKLDENFVIIDETNVKVAEQIQDSANFPGIRTLYRKEVIAAQIVDPSDLP